MKKLTKKEQQRIIVLKDALAQIKSGAYEVKSYTGYVAQTGFDTLDEDIDNLKSYCELFTDKKPDEIEFNKFFKKIINPKKPCQVCAKGSLFLSTINKFNNFTLDEAYKSDLNNLASDNYKTSDLFDDYNLDLMEKYFEKNDPLDEKTSEQWSDQYPDDKDRLVAIIKNAIKNRGVFKP